MEQYGKKENQSRTVEHISMKQSKNSKKWENPENWKLKTGKPEIKNRKNRKKSQSKILEV